MAWLGLASDMTHAESRHFRTSDGVRLHYDDRGQARSEGARASILFVPGWSMPAAIWEPQLSYFARQYRVVALDPRGQGESAIAPAGYTPERRARDIAELIVAAGLQRPVIVGWSLGVLEALAYVEAHGDLAHAGLVLVDNSVGEEPAPRGGKGPAFTSRLRADRVQTVRGFVRSMYRAPQPEAYLESIERAALRTPLEASVALLSWNWPRTRWRDALYATRKPVLYVVTPSFAAQAANVARKRPDIRTEVFAQAGHALFVDEVARFNGLLDEFLETLSGAD
jgi:microsomal epoxide hydrolase